MAELEIELQQAEGGKGDPMKAGHYVKFLKHNGEFAALQGLFPNASLRSLDQAIVALVKGSTVKYNGKRYRIVQE